MKLREEFILHEANGSQVLVATGKARFSGMVRCNRSAAAIVECLMRGASEAEICDSLERRFDAPRSVIAADVGRVLAQLRDIGAIDDDA